MKIFKKACTLLFLFLFVFLTAITSKAEKGKFEQAKEYLNNGVSTYNEKLLHDARKILIQLIKENPSDYIYVHYVALAHLGLCDMKNFEIAKCSVKKKKKALKAKRVAIAEKGLPFADKSIELNDNFSESYRVRGALISNKISGMISGMRNGSLAEEAIDIALQIDENNPMARIENARMYINKPGILGGDINKGIDILNNVIKSNSGLEKGYINLGIAYQENGEVEKAINTFKRLLEINPDNPEARFFLDQLMLSK
ncbi:MAG: tetratricopeptide repeat protein [Candidatus Scalindua sp.]